MRSLIVFFALLGIGTGVWCLKDVDNVRKIGAECMEEHDSTLEVFQQFRTRKLEPSAIKANEKCGMHCLLLAMKLIDDAGVIDYAVAEDYYSVQKSKDEKIRALQECDKTSVDADLCERSFKILLCMLDYMDW